MREIPLTQGKVAIIDDADFELVAGFSWYAWKKKGKDAFYALANTKKSGASKKTIVQMHRVILGVDRGVLVDHKNRNGLDNRRANLRPCDFTLNNGNSRKRPNCSSQFKGVHLTDTHRWAAQIAFHGRTMRLGRYGTETEAAKAYDDAALELFGEFARLNFPEVARAS